MSSEICVTQWCLFLYFLKIENEPRPFVKTYFWHLLSFTPSRKIICFTRKRFICFKKRLWIYFCNEIIRKNHMLIFHMYHKYYILKWLFTNLFSSKFISWDKTFELFKKSSLHMGKIMYASKFLTKKLWKWYKHDV